MIIVIPPAAEQTPEHFFFLSYFTQNIEEKSQDNLVILF